jgi:hypothetical protein
MSALDLGKANLSRVLGVMERSELIEKHSQGNENVIKLGLRGRQFLGVDEPRPKAAAEPRMKPAESKPAYVRGMARFIPQEPVDAPI